LLNKFRLLRSTEDHELRVVDRLVILEHDGRLCEVLDVEDVNEDRILAPGYSVPTQDVKEYISPRGRVFVLHAPEEYIEETKHLAAVEQNTVIRHAIQYERMTPAKADMGKMMPWLLIGLLLILVVFR
jgi:hypothetical protein